MEQEEIVMLVTEANTRIEEGIRVRTKLIRRGKQSTNPRQHQERIQVFLL